MFDNVSQHKIVEITGFDLMASAGVFTQAVVGLADVVRLVNRFPRFSGKAVLSSPAYLLIAYLHRLPTGSAVDKAVKQIVILNFNKAL